MGSSAGADFPCEPHVSKRVITVTAWIITLLLATVLNVHFLTGMNQNKTDIVDLQGGLEKWHVVVNMQRIDIKALRTKVRYLTDNLDVNVLLIDELRLQVKELRRDITNLGKGLGTDANVIFEKIKKLRADVMTVNKSTHILAGWLKKVDADIDPGYLAKMESQIRALERKMR